MPLNPELKAQSSQLLADILSPMSTEDFYSDYWEKEVLHLKPDPDLVKSLFTVKDLEARVRFSPGAGRNLRLIHKGLALAPVNFSTNGLVDADKVLDLVASGTTLVANGIHRFSDHLLWFIREFENSTGCHLGCNLYWTPFESSGLDTHFDYHDIFVTQLRGAKRWRTYGMETPVPVKGLNPQKDGIERVTDQDFEIKAGEIFYLPRGVSHTVWCEESESIHLTVGLHPTTWYGYLQTALEIAARENPELRTALPMSSVDPQDRHAQAVELIGRLPELFSREKVEEQLQARRRYTGVGREHLKRLDTLPEVQADSTLAIRGSFEWSSKNQILELARDYNYDFRLRAEFEPQLKQMKELSTFTPADIQGLELEHAVLFCHYLRLNGFLEDASASAGDGD